jgi:hypothetical protein
MGADLSPHFDAVAESMTTGNSATHPSAIQSFTFPVPTPYPPNKAEGTAMPVTSPK